MADKVYKNPLALAQDEFQTLVNEDNDTYQETLRNKKGWSGDGAAKQAALFTPTKETIWNDPKHPLYGIAPSEQNEDFLNSAISEIARKTQSPAHWRFYGGPQSGGTRLDAIKKLKQYRKALEYIRNGGK